jgi:hypothetical protein
MRDRLADADAIVPRFMPLGFQRRHEQVTLKVVTELVQRAVADLAATRSQAPPKRLSRPRSW